MVRAVVKLPILSRNADNICLIINAMSRFDYVANIPIDKAISLDQKKKPFVSM